MTRLTLIILIASGTVAALSRVSVKAPSDSAGAQRAPHPPITSTVLSLPSPIIVKDDPHAFYTDHRAWQHGINIVRVGGKEMIVWSSWGNPPAPQPNPEGNWEHDVYYSWLDPKHPSLDPHTLVTAPEAQEPASCAVNSEGRLLMSCEDGNPDINQHAGLWDSDLNVIQSYPMLVHDGGHSGHVAALGDKFLVVFSDGWVDGGGVDNLGTGDDVYARIIDNDGNMEEEIPTSVDPAPDKRDWWPVVAASDRNWLEVWQRYPSGTLHGALIGPDGKIQSRVQITDDIDFYHYNITYLPKLKLYAVIGSRHDGGFVSLIDPDGNVVLTRTGLPHFVRESRLIAHDSGRSEIGVYPVESGGVAVVRITPKSVDLVKTISDPYPWDYMGTDGLFVDKHQVLFATLSKAGLQFLAFHDIP